MNKQKSLIDILNKNEKKILEAAKYTKDELTALINDIANTENVRRSILEKIKEYKSIDLSKLKSELSLSEKNLLCDLKYLKEFGYLKDIGENPRFFHQEIQKLDDYGL